MSDKYCPFLKENPHAGLFSASYVCAKTDEEIMTGSAIYEQYCSDYESSYCQCPYFKPEEK